MAGGGPVRPASKFAAVDRVRKSEPRDLPKLKAERDHQATASQRHSWLHLPFGLSLAETMMMVLIAVVVVMGVRLAQVQAKADEGLRTQKKLRANLAELKPLLHSLRQKPRLDGLSIDTLADKLARLNDAESRAADLARENSTLRKQLADRSSLPAAHPAPEATVLEGGIANSHSQPPEPEVTAVASPEATAVALETAVHKLPEPPVSREGLESPPVSKVDAKIWRPGVKTTMKLLN